MLNFFIVNSMFSLFCRTLRATLARVSRWQVREYILPVLQYCAWCLKVLQAIVKTVGWIKKLPPRLSDANVNSIVENLKVPTDLNVLLSWKWMSPSLPPGFKSFFFFFYHGYKRFFLTHSLLLFFSADFEGCFSWTGDISLKRSRGLGKTQKICHCVSFDLNSSYSMN